METETGKEYGDTSSRKLKVTVNKVTSELDVSHLDEKIVNEISEVEIDNSINFGITPGDGNRESGMLQLLENLGTGALPTIENSAAITTHLPPGAINVIESLGDLSIVGGKGGSRDRDDRDGGKPMLQNIGNEKNMTAISDTYNRVQDMLTQLDILHNAMLQKHQTDFLTAYRDHMLRVQVELIQFKKKSSDYYQKMKSDEKIQMLESSIQWLRDESLNLAGNIETLKENNKKLNTQLQYARDEMFSWKEKSYTLKAYNTILQGTICKLKSPTLIEKYEDLGRRKAEKEFKKVLSQMRSGRSGNALNQSQEFREVNPRNTLAKTFASYNDSSTAGKLPRVGEDVAASLENLTDEEILNKFKIAQPSIDENDEEQPLVSVSTLTGIGGRKTTAMAMKSHTKGISSSKARSRVLRQQRQASMKAATASQPRLSADKYDVDASVSQGDSKSQMKHSFNSGTGKPSSAMPGRRGAHQRMRMHHARILSTRTGLESMRVVGKPPVDNGATLNSGQFFDEETKVGTNDINATGYEGHLDLKITPSGEFALGHSYSQSHRQNFSRRDLAAALAELNQATQVKVSEMVKTFANDPTQLESQLLNELNSQNEKVVNLTDRITALEHMIMARQTSKPKSQTEILRANQSDLAAAINNMVQQPLDSQSPGRHRESSRSGFRSTGKMSSIADTNLLPPEMLQEMFFDCVQSFIKVRKRDAFVEKANSSSPSKLGQRRSSSTPSMQTIRRKFQHFTDFERQEVLLNFVGNKQVLHSLYELMFLENASLNKNRTNNGYEGLINIIKDEKALIQQQVMQERALLARGGRSVPQGTQSSLIVKPYVNDDEQEGHRVHTDPSMQQMSQTMVRDSFQNQPERMLQGVNSEPKVLIMRPDEQNNNMMQNFVMVQDGQIVGLPMVNMNPPEALSGEQTMPQQTTSESQIGRGEGTNLRSSEAVNSRVSRVSSAYPIGSRPKPVKNGSKEVLTGSEANGTIVSKFAHKYTAPQTGKSDANLQGIGGIFAGGLQSQFSSSEQQSTQNQKTHSHIHPMALLFHQMPQQNLPPVTSDTNSAYNGSYNQVPPAHQNQFNQLQRPGYQMKTMRAEANQSRSRLPSGTTLDRTHGDSHLIQNKRKVRASSSYRIKDGRLLVNNASNANVE